MRRGLLFQTVMALAVFLAIVVAAFVVTAVAVVELDDAGSTATHSAEVQATANSLELTTVEMETGLGGYLLTGQRQFLQLNGSAVSRYPALGRQLVALTAGNPVQHARAQQIVRAVDVYAKTWSVPMAHKALTDPAGVRQAIASGGGKRQLDAIAALFVTFDRQQRALSAVQTAHASNIGSFAFDFALGAMSLLVLLVVGYGLSMRWHLVEPLQDLVRALARVGNGELSVRVPERGRGEITVLTARFNAMVGDLEADRDELENQNAELEAQQVEIESAIARSQEQKAHSERLRRFGDRLAATSGLADFCAAALREMADLARADVGALYLLDEGAGTYRLRAARGLSSSELAPEVATGQGLAGRAIAERRPVLVSFGQTSLHVAGLGLGTAHRPVHEVHVPVLHGERTIGVLSLGRLADEAIGAEDEALVVELTRRVGVGAAERLSAQQRQAVAHELETLLGSIEEGVFAVDDGGRVTMVNRAALEQTGFAREDLLGHRAHVLLHHTRVDGTPYPERECPTARTYRERTAVRIGGEVFWRRDGSSFPVEYSSYPLFDAGELKGAVVTFRDIRARLVTERQRDTQHAVTRVLAEATSVGRALPKLLEVLCQGFGWKLGLAWQPLPEGSEDGGALACVSSFASPGYEPAAERLASEVLEAGNGPAGTGLARREPVLVPDLARAQARPGLPPEVLGAWLTDAVAVPILDERDEVLGIAEFFSNRPIAEQGLLATLQAIAAQSAQFFERKRREHETERMRQEFVATVSHELRTPLTSIDGWLHILLDEEPGPLNADQRRFLTTVKRNSDRLIRLVGDLLVAGQIEAGKMILEREDVDISLLAREVVELIGPSATAKGLHVDLHCDEPAVVHGDRARLTQLLNNLTSNAIKYTPENGHIWVTVRSAAPVCQITVSDDGIGIAPEERDNLFRRFFRASSAIEHGVAGTGLGLAITRAIAERHGGTVELGEHEGPGTTFVVTLPLARGAEADGSAAQRAAPHGANHVAGPLREDVRR